MNDAPMMHLGNAKRWTNILFCIIFLLYFTCRNIFISYKAIKSNKNNDDSTKLIPEETIVATIATPPSSSKDDSLETDLSSLSSSSLHATDAKPVSIESINTTSTRIITSNEATTIINTIYDNITSLPFHHHRQIIPLNNNWSFEGYLSRFAQLRTDPISSSFQNDAARLKQQLTHNYAINTSCSTVSLPELHPVVTHFPPSYCYGLGSTILFYNTLLSNLTYYNQSVIVRDIDDGITCGWFQRDTTRPCTTMFGNCYFRALRRPSASNVSSTCFDVSWFVETWGMEAYSSVHLTWLLRVNHDDHPDPETISVDQQPSNSSNEKQQAIALIAEEAETDILSTQNTDVDSSACIALHIRRGDTCHIRKLRSCVAYDDYYRAIQIVLQEKKFQRLVVMTDAPDFPLAKFQELIPNIVFSSTTDRTKYTLDTKLLKQLRKKQSRRRIFPEHRDLGNATSEFVQEWELGSQCQALVGTFSASISCLLFQHMLAQQGRVPIFVSLQSCLHQVNALQVNNKGCEATFFREPSEYRILPV